MADTTPKHGHAALYDHAAEVQEDIIKHDVAMGGFDDYAYDKETEKRHEQQRLDAIERLPEDAIDILDELAGTNRWEEFKAVLAHCIALAENRERLEARRGPTSRYGCEREAV